VNKKYFVAIIILIFGISNCFAASIFSPLGYVEENYGVDNFSAGMGQTGICSLNRRNFSSCNPALNTTIRNSNFFSKIDFIFTKYKTTENREFDTETTSFPYVKVVIPLTKQIKLGFKFFDKYHRSLETSNQDSIIDISLADFENSFQGAINQFGVSVARKFNNISFGLGLDFNYGFRRREQEIDFDESDFVDYSEINQYLFNGASLTFGFAFPVSRFSFGGFYQTKSSMDSNDKHTIEYLEDSNLDYSEDSSSSYDLPAEFGIGVGVEINDQFYFETNYRSSFWSKAYNSQEQDLQDSKFFSIGISYFPYEKKWLIPIRTGGYYKELPYQEEGENIIEKAVTLGFDIPLKLKNKGSINLLFSYGTRGNVSECGFSDEFYKISVGFSSFDRWINPEKYKKDKKIPKAAPEYSYR